MNPSLEQKENHGPRAQAGGFGGEGAGGGLKWEGGVSRRQLSCGGWINSKALLYSAGNYDKPMINRTARELLEHCAYVYIHEELTHWQSP